jgi:hypothetical protein
MKGLNRRWAYGQQQPDTSIHMLNMRPDESAEDRTRGGTRPGIIRPYVTRVGADEVRLLSQVRAVPTNQNRFFFDDFNAFPDGGLFQNAIWTLPEGSNKEPQYIVIGGEPAVQDNLDFPLTDQFKSCAVLKLIAEADLSLSYEVAVTTVGRLDSSFPYGRLTIYAGLDDTTPSLISDYVALHVSWQSPASLSLSVFQVAGGVVVLTDATSVITGISTVLPHAIKMEVNPSAQTITGFLDGVQYAQITGVTFPLATGGGRIGFDLFTSEVLQRAAIDNFIFTYSVGTASNAQANRNYMVAGANQGLMRETIEGDDIETAAAGSSANIVQVPPLPQQTIQAQDYLGKLYIADHDEPIATGDDGVAAGNTLVSGSNLSMGNSVDADNDVVVIAGPITSKILGTYLVASGTGGVITLVETFAFAEAGLTFRVERAPKVYDPIADTLEIWYDPLVSVGGTGVVANQPPTGCIVIGTFLDRIALAGGKNNPSVWFLSGRGDALNWNFASTGEGGAVAGDNSNAGQIGAPITAMVPSIEDYLLLGSLGSLYILRGDPTVGGRLDNMSRRIGIVGTEAWCYGPNSSVFFLSRDGLYMIAPGATSYPQSLSEEVLPGPLKNVNNVNTHVMLEYDVLNRGIHIHLTNVNSGIALSYWYDLEIPGFWPFRYATANHQPFTTLQYEADKSTSAAMLMGGRDGYIRKYAKSASVDDNIDQTAISSNIVLGPIPLGSSPDAEGLLQRIEIILGRDSNPVNWRMYIGNTAEEAIHNWQFSNIYKSGVTRELTEGENRSLLSVHHPRVRDYYVVIRLSNDDANRWWFEQMVAIIKDVGRHRSKTV